VTAHVIHFKVNGGEMITSTATGEDIMSNLIPFGLDKGNAFDTADAVVYPVYFSAE
jgi:hypothetical protein